VQKIPLSIDAFTAFHRWRDMANSKERLFLNDIITKSGETFSDVSRLIGRNHSYIQQFIRRGIPRKLDEQDRRLIARHFGVQEHLLGGNFFLEPEASAAPRRGQTFPVPRLSINAAVGTALPEAPEKTDFLIIDTRWLKDLGTRPSHVSIVRIDGEAMAPTLTHGDEVMVDHSDSVQRLRDGLYALRLDGILMVKRIVQGPNRGKFTIVSDNPHYPRWNQITSDLVDIVGRVIWVGRPVR